MLSFEKKRLLSNQQKTLDALNQMHSDLDFLDARIKRAHGPTCDVFGNPCT